MGDLPADGVKLQLLHVLRGTDLGRLYEAEPFPVLSLEEYLDLVVDAVSLLPPEVVIHRISGDGPSGCCWPPHGAATNTWF